MNTIAAAMMIINLGIMYIIAFRSTPDENNQISTAKVIYFYVAMIAAITSAIFLFWMVL